MVEVTCNALSFDVEYWYSPELIRRHCVGREDDQIVESLKPILDLLDSHNTKCTFFVLGMVADKHPELVKTIWERGHEIGSHGYSHKRLYDLSQAQFEDEVCRCVSLQESITGERPVGFRAPTFSLDPSTSWALEILRKHGFRYDSSICPSKTPLYGISGAPLHAYRPSAENMLVDDPCGDIIEFPITVFRLGVGIPVAGGFYLRSLPAWFTRLAIRQVVKARPVMVFVHPWETYPATPRLKGLPLLSRLVTYYGINSSLKKLEALLDEFQFKPIREVLRISS